MKQYVVLLATDDSAVESSVRTLAKRAECGLNCVKTSREAFSTVVDHAMDGFMEQDMAVLDLDLFEGARAVLTTVAGKLPVIAITGKERPWLSAMMRRCRVRATFVKPVSPEKLRAAFECVRNLEGVAIHDVR